MAKFSLYFLLLFSFHYMGLKVSSADDPSDTNFIKSSCRITLYPVLCFDCLSGYANIIQQNDRQLAQAAISVSLARAQDVAMFVSTITQAAGLKPREYQAVKDCVDNMASTVDQLSRSIDEMGQVGGQDFGWHMSNVETWVSAALTNENTCVDGFAAPDMEGNIKVAIKNKVTDVAHVTSNALALVNRFAARHR